MPNDRLCQPREPRTAIEGLSGKAMRQRVKQRWKRSQELVQNTSAFDSRRSVAVLGGVFYCGPLKTRSDKFSIFALHFKQRIDPYQITAIVRLMPRLKMRGLKGSRRELYRSSGK